MLVKGIDVSKWQAEITWPKTKLAGMDFAIIRAGSVDNITGKCYIDFQFERNSIEAPKVMPVGYYWYFRPGQNPITQAQYFADLINPAGFTIYPTCDIEESNGKSPQHITSVLWTFCDRIKKLTGTECMIYTSPGYAMSYFQPNSWMKDLPLWIAHWNVSQPIIPVQWRDYAKTYTFWQTHVGQDAQEYGMGIGSAGLDHDVYRGEWEDFAKEFKLKQPPQPPIVYPSTETMIKKLWDAHPKLYGE